MTNPQIKNLEKVAAILANVTERFVFTGGGTIVLYVDEINCPVWTEDADFFGTGVATWTSDRVHLYLSKDEQNISNDDE